jgi:Family of unknown function (DUF5947)
MDERCELCALPLADEHAHLFERERRTIVCACAACAMLFSTIEAARYGRIRPSVRRFAGLVIDDATWSALGIPVGLAFLTRTASGDVLAAYPGPGGGTTSMVDRDAWSAVVTRYPALNELEPDLEAWLINRLAAEPQHYRVSVDHCYRLAGLMRSRWKGISGGPDVAAAIVEFFRTMEEQAA